MQCRDGHISTCLIKTLVNYLCCAYCALCQLSIRYLFIVVHYLFICAHYSLLSFIYFVHCSTFHPCCCSILSFFDSFTFIILCALFKREKIQFNSDPGLCSRYFDPVQVNLHTTSSMWVNKHHKQTAPTLS